MRKTKLLIFDFEDTLWDSHASKPFPGVIEFLTQSPHLVAIVSNRDDLSLNRLIRGSDFHHITWTQVTGADTYEHKKPHPLPLIKTVENAEVTTDETIMIGDSFTDALSAREAGIPFIGVSIGHSKESDLRQFGATEVISDFSELPAAIQRVDLKRNSSVD